MHEPKPGSKIGSVAGIEDDRGEMRQSGREVRTRPVSGISKISQNVSQSLCTNPNQAAKSEVLLG